MSRHLVWLRLDLRSRDHAALQAACRDPDSEVVAVYLHTPGQSARHDLGARRSAFERDALAALQPTLARLGIPLVQAELDDYAAIPAWMVERVRAWGIGAIHAHRALEIYEQRRDEAVAAAVATEACRLCLYDDVCILPPGRVLTRDGRPFTVFSAFKKAWLQQLPTVAAAQPQPRPRRQHFLPLCAEPTPVKPQEQDWPAGEAAALAALDAFVAQGLADYAWARDRCDLAGSSRLSPYLTLGCLSARQCLHALYRQGPVDAPGAASWLNELCWRDFYKHILVAFPQVGRHQAFQAATDALPWRYDELEFARWREGRTGFPIVNAGMRQLLQTGWMHNRLRMICASFLAKDLFIDWRWGERHFMQHLLDADLAANNGGWQWSASTGNDAVPYFRVFNPWLQSRKVDPQGHFIRQYVPELAAVQEVHTPVLRHADYPAPMLDHGQARQRVIAHFRALRGDSAQLGLWADDGS